MSAKTDNILELINELSNEELSLLYKKNVNRILEGRIENISIKKSEEKYKYLEEFINKKVIIYKKDSIIIGILKKYRYFPYSGLQFELDETVFIRPDFITRCNETYTEFYALDIITIELLNLDLDIDITNKLNTINKLEKLIKKTSTNMYNTIKNYANQT